MAACTAVVVNESSDNHDEFGDPADDTRRTETVYIYCTPEEKQAWERSAKQDGRTSLSSYLSDLIKEAQALRDEDYRGRTQLEQRVQELEEEVARLEAALEAVQDDTTVEESLQHQLDMDDPRFLRQVLTEEYQSFPEIVQQIIESNVLDTLVRKPVERGLYELAAEDTVEYRRGCGWKLAEEP